MTYQEIKDRLSKCEYTLSKLKDSTSKEKDIKTINKLEILKESLQKKLLLKETQTITDKQKAKLKDIVKQLKGSVKGHGAQAKAIDKIVSEEDGVIFTDDERKAKELAKDGARVKLTKEEEQVEKLSKEEVSSIAKEAGKAVVQVIQQSGDEVSKAKIKDVYASALSGDSSPEAFTVHIIYKNNSEVSYRFQIINNILYYLADNQDVKLSDVGIKPSGEPLLNKELIKNEMSKYFKQMSEMTDQEFADAKEADRLASHPEKDKILAIQQLIAKEKGLKEDEYDDMVASDDDIPDDKKKGAAKALRMVDKGASYDKVKKHLKEAPYQTTYIKVAKSDYKKAMGILDKNIDPTYAKMDVVDDDGSGNVIIYFNFRAKDDGEPGEDPSEFIYDLSMDLEANGINITSASHDIDETKDINDPVLMKLRALKSKIGRKKKDSIAIPPKNLAILSKLQTKRSQVLKDMEQEAEPEGGPIADKYGDMLNKIDTAIAKAKGIKNEGWNDRDDLFTFGYDLDMIQAVVDHLKSNYSEDDYELHIGRGDTHPNAVTLKNPKMDNDEELGDLLIAAEDQEQTDYQSGRELEKDYMGEKKRPGLWANIRAKRARGEKPAHKNSNAHKDAVKAGKKINKENNYMEDKDIGHQDDEPNMLKSSAFETAQYAAKLVKKLNVYDKHDGEVDFPTWWQKKLILARDYMSAAFHYLDSEEKQPAIDKLALENVDEYSSGPWTKHKLLAYLGQADDAMIRTHDDKYLIIYNPKNGNDDNAKMWKDDSVFGVDQDGQEHEVSYDNIDGLQLEQIKENSEFETADKWSDDGRYYVKVEDNGKGGKWIIDPNQSKYTPGTKLILNTLDEQEYRFEDAEDYFLQVQRMEALKNEAEAEHLINRYGTDLVDELELHKEWHDVMFPEDIEDDDDDDELYESAELDKITKAKRLIKQQAPAMNKLPQDDPKRKAFIDRVKQINQKYKELLAKQDNKISGIGKDQELDEGRGDFDDVLKAIENMSNNDDISERDAAAEIVLALADRFQLPVDKNLEDYMEEGESDLYEVKVGDTLTKDGKKGKVTKVSDTQATVDFGNGDVYGIAHSRIKGKEILKEGTDLHVDKDFQFTRTNSGIQITEKYSGYGPNSRYIHVPGRLLKRFIAGLAKSSKVFKDIKYQGQDAENPLQENK